MSKVTTSVFALALVALASFGIVSAIGPQFLGFDDAGLGVMQNQSMAIQNAIETGDYASWEALMQERLAIMEDQINEDTFAQMKENYENREALKAAMDDARESGDWSEVEALREELGMPDKPEDGMGRGMGPRNGDGMMGECPMASSD